MGTSFATLRIFGASLPTFFLVLSLVATLSILWIHSRATKLGLDPRRATDLSLIAWVGGLVGSRLFHVLYEAPSYYLEDPMRFWEFTSGGFVFFGGVILGAVAWIAGFVHWKPGPWRNWADLVAPVLAFGHGAGRIGCLAAGCCYGKVCDLPWAVAGRHPVPLYLTFWDMGVMFVLLARESLASNSRWKVPGLGIAGWAILHGIGRFLIEFLRDDFRGPDFGLSISQWISMILVGIGCLVLRHSLSQPAAGTDENAK